jgi:hemerythrin-like domain-containing protein
MGIAKATIDPPSDALKLLIEQHDTIDQMIAQLIDDRPLSYERKALLFRTLADTIAAHVAAEETIFYPALRAKGADRIIDESVDDHAAIRHELAELVLSELDDPRFAAKLQILQAQLEHHARDHEEAVLFPRARKLLSDEELAELGGRMRALFEELLTEEPAFEVPRQAREAALHLR